MGAQSHSHWTTSLAHTDSNDILRSIPYHSLPNTPSFHSLHKTVLSGVLPMHLSVTINKQKFMCQRHSDAKQSEMLEFGAEKGLLEGHAWGMGDSG